MNNKITKQEITNIQKSWGDAIVKIGDLYLKNEAYKAEAREQIKKLYAYNLGLVLFKPTMATQRQFRVTKEGALSYFIGNNENYPEDKGFAINPWTSIRWENAGIKIEGCIAIVMGNYFFTPLDGDELKVEYTMGYQKDENGDLQIILHDSHLPYSDVAPCGENT